MEQIEIILRITESSGKVTERLLAEFDAIQTVKEKKEVINYSGLCIDPIQHQVSYEGSALPLTETYEFQTLVYLASQPGRVYTKEQIYQHIYEEAESEVNNRIYGLIKNLRKKIEENPETPHYIETIRGVGYRFRA